MLLWYASPQPPVLREVSRKAQETLIYDFGPFRFLPDEKVLLREGRPVPLPPKAIDTLAVLLDRSGHVVLKDDLIRSVWPDTFVEEGNLTQQISLTEFAWIPVLLMLTISVVPATRSRTKASE